ncbi:major facilitator superfamily transporter [Fusarium beomiforme]|uniref:Major facilitator superfamily transporter n=1 Tax=Fusarium beomiforme TaxID=44412 RepID=A0A9P5DND3_9HYPO|nr:major facilitator superfamily transporter [Fusarium beomiforme]
MVVVAGILMSLTWTLIVITNPVFPVKLVWVSALFLLVGGGRYAAEMLLAAIIAKACTEETRSASPWIAQEAKLTFKGLEISTNSTRASSSASS